MKKIFFLFIFFCFFGEGCSSSASDAYEESPETIDGMILVHGETATLGSNDHQYKPSERPAMKVHLDYDFFLSIHEMTCGEYRALAKEQKLHDFGKCKKDSLPLTDVTFYDAVLAANAKSKSENRDTAYTYTNVSFDSEGHCTNLDAFIFHPEADAYRLPTESEWVLAASKGWDPQNKSWNADNSNYKKHAVCTAGKDSQGFCDFAGNVKEWVNDWAGTFRDTTITNYMGALNGGDLGERIVKGGYFSDKPSEMNFIARGDEYSVDGSTHAEHIGFRLAFGHIPSPVWLDASGKARTSTISALANAATLKNFTRTYNMILAFRNDMSGNLAFIDYNDGSLSVTEIYDSIATYHPDISPDGKHVAFCTKPEGISGKSSLYVRDLNAKGTNLVKLDVKSAAIPRWRVLGNGDTVIVYVTDAGNNKDSIAFKKTSTWQVKFAKNKFGTPQRLFDGAYHGGISEDNTLAVSGARLLRARVAKSKSTISEKASDKIWYNSEQACNASLVQDGSKRTAFLDFSGKTGKKFVGETYATHERILIADSTGKLEQTLKAPADYTFDHTEWATDGKTSNIVATLANTNGAHTKIVLTSPADSSIIELAEGEELWHPCLWVKRRLAVNGTSNESGIEFELDPDSAGIYYNNSGATPNADIYRYKMELLWKYRDSSNTVILGSSRSYRGVNPDNFSKGISAINLAVPATVINASQYLFENYVLPHVKNLKVVILSIDIDRGYISGNNSNNIFFTAYKSYPGYVYDENHNFWKDGYPKGLYNATYESPGKKDLEGNLRTHRGFFEIKSSSWGDPIITEDSCWMDTKADIYHKNFERLIDFIELCKQNGIYLIGVLFPMNPKYQNTGAYGYAGLRRSEAPSLIKDITKLSKTYPNFILMDENKMGNHDYTDEMASDYSHLSAAGAKKLTTRLDSLIKTLDIRFDDKKEQ